MRFAIALQLTNAAEGQMHTQVLYRFDGELKLGDVGNHFYSRRRLANESHNIFWIQPRLSAEDERILAATVDAWLEKNEGKIPYSVAHPGGVVFKDNVWVGGPGQGLTCATFVVELFEELGIPFIDRDSWEPRHGDEEWAQRILESMKERMTNEHVDAQMKLLGATVRIRPADVGAAAALVDDEMEQPLRFAEVVPCSYEIEETFMPSLEEDDEQGPPAAERAE